ncbi:MAG: YHS domain-containing (seleno)protein [Alphaproteobacteria bacterium]|nr:YHS domain-containing (seleno)protein [Alphaproteobacteria bacterium]MDP6564356.1 YHS domain-containing (seleno)protein [Alphaproteobacteria bacterium]MDP6812526.1 YHS domain-containing (seleno)protein [Alphaproteobacteria bacterium]
MHATRRSILERIRGILVAVGALVLLSGAPAWAKAPIYSDWLGRAIGGFDPVAYFTMGKPVKGSGDFTAEWQGATWRFVSAANRDAFIAGPEKYAPQYGGYCAYAVSQGYTASIEPEAWHLVNGKLYLNYSLEVWQTWLADRDAYIAAADRNWPGVLE